MKRFRKFALIGLAILLAACTASTSPAGQEAAADPNPGLLVAGGEVSRTYTRADLEALPATQADFNDVTYVGVSVSTLLEDAGFDLAAVKAVKAIASDGFAVNYDPAQVLAANVIVAYARAEGDLTAEEGAFRMVLPGTEGKLNPRLLVELRVIQ